MNLIKARPLIIAIDQSTGKKSKLGLAVFFPMTATDPPKIFYVAEISADRATDSADRRIQSIARTLDKHLQEFIYKSVDEQGLTITAIVFEHFVMRGKGGETLAKMVGACLVLLPPDVQIIYANNNITKQYVAGKGGSEKELVAAGVKDYFSRSQNLSEIEDLISLHKWDILDALAIGITGYHLQIAPIDVGQSEPKSTKRSGKKWPKI